MNRQSVEKILSSYFDGAEAEINVVMAGRIPYIDIQYSDFKPTNAVRRELGQLIPNIEWVCLERRYSRERIMEELWQMYNEDTDMLIRDGTDTFRSTILSICVQERMQHREFTQKQE